MHIVVVLVLAVIVWVVWSNNNEVFRIDVVNGDAWVARGSVPDGFLHTVSRVVQEPRVAQGSIRGIKAEDGVRLDATGLTEGQLQRLRNTHRLSPQAGFRSGENPVNERNFWRAMDVARLLRVFFRR